MGLWKSFHLILIHFIHNFSMLWGEVASNSVDFQKFIFFYNFDRSSLFFDQSKLQLKISVSLCLFRLIETVFRLIEYCESGFLKSNVWPVQNTFQKFFQLFSLSRTRQSKIIQFLSFSSESFARFSSPKAGTSILPFFLHFISCLHA